jgi:hypothetical protein
MTQEHPITPPQELRDKWLDEAPNTSVYDYLIDSAAQWGADQELEACCTFLEKEYPWAIETERECTNASKDLRAARRLKPPSLKEQALEALAHILNNSSTQLGADTIRRALEQLPNNN